MPPRSGSGFCLLCVLTACLCAQSQNGFQIIGTVIDSQTKQPLGRIRISLAQPGKPNRQIDMITAADGRFRFWGLPAGKYILQAQRPGSMPQGYLAHEGVQTGIAVGPKYDSEHIVFPLEEPASITGTVVDEQGEGVRQVQVNLFARRVVDGRRRVTHAGVRTTDSSGWFHFGNLGAGTYYIAATGQPWYARTPPSGQPQQPDKEHSELDVAYPITYYANTTDPGSAAPIRLPGGAAETIQIAFRAVPAVHLRIEQPESQPDDSATPVFAPGMARMPPRRIRRPFFPPMISAEGPEHTQINISGTSFSGEPGSQVISLAPGHYIVDARRLEGQRMKLLGMREVDLEGDTTLDLSGATGASLTGHLAIEGEQTDRSGVGIFLANTNSPGTGYQDQPKPDGSFVEEDPVYAGEYQVNLMNAPGYYIKSIVAKGADVSGTMLTTPESGSIELNIVAAKSEGSELGGVALRDGKPFPGAMVLLLPDDLNGIIPRDQSDSDGAFTLHSAMPGHYTLLAIDNGRDLAYRDAATIKPYLARGESINAPVSGARQIQIEVQRRVREQEAQ